jgi:hypothetical protein
LRQDFQNDEGIHVTPSKPRAILDRNTSGKEF